MKSPKCTTEKLSVTVDGYSGSVEPTPREIRLKTADDIRLEMGRCYRDMKRGKISSSEGTKLVYVLSQIGKMIELHEIENRLIALEQLKEKENEQIIKKN